jgi:uncharacterized membrane protein YeiB
MLLAMMFWSPLAHEEGPRAHELKPLKALGRISLSSFQMVISGILSWDRGLTSHSHATALLCKLPLILLLQCLAIFSAFPSAL